METIELTSSIWEKYVECPMGGTVIQGDYCGTNLFRADDDEYVLSYNNKVAWGRGSAPYNIVKVAYRINKSTVERYEIVSEDELKPDPKSVFKAGFWLGSAGALAVSSNSIKTYVVAIYFKNGQKSLLKVFHQNVLNALKSALFTF